MTIAEGVLGKEYKVVALHTQDEELEDFLFRLGCYVGEKSVVISHVSESYVIAIKDGRYNIDKRLAESITIE